MDYVRIYIDLSLRVEFTALCCCYKGVVTMKSRVCYESFVTTRRLHDKACHVPLPICLVILLDDWWWLGDLPSEDVPLDEIRKPHGQFVADELFRWDREDLYKRRQHEVV